MINLSRAAFKNLVANCYADKEADDISREGKGILYAHERIEELERALKALLYDYTELVLPDSTLLWDSEEETAVINARKALGGDA